MSAKVPQNYMSPESIHFLNRLARKRFATLRKMRAERAARQRVWNEPIDETVGEPMDAPSNVVMLHRS